MNVIEWTPGMAKVTQPCVIDGMPDEEYHRDFVEGGSLSHSGLKTIRDVPARFAWERENGREPKDHYDYGHLIHKIVLGVGPDLAILPEGDGRTKAVRDAKLAARKDGKVPVKPADWRKAKAMAAVLRGHHTGSSLFTPGRGIAERSIAWFDTQWNLWRRARFDWCMYLPDGRFAVVDFKSAAGKVSPWALGKRVFDFGYHTQDAFYSEGAYEVGLADDPGDVVFLFAFQEVDAPHLVTVVELDQESREQGHRDVQDGLRRYRACLDSGQFPDYAPGVITVRIPQYGFREYAA